MGSPAETPEAWREVNRTMWNERAALHPDTDLYDVAGLVAGRDDLRPWEPAELGPVEGLDLLHLQCHIGTDSVGWARRGANVVGLDFSPVALAAARRLSDACGLTMEWVEADVHHAPSALGGRTFDVVYTGIGALCWLPDLERWAGVVRDLLRPDGVLYLVEIHPMWMAVWGDGTTISQQAIDAPFERWEDEDPRSYAAPDVPLREAVSFERLHSISDVLSAVLGAGLRIELFHEFDVTPAPTAWLEQGADRLFHFPAGMLRFPVTYSLRARRTMLG